MTSWKQPGSTNNNKHPSLSPSSSLHEKCLCNRLKAASLLSQTLALTNDSRNPGRGNGLQRIKETDGWKGLGNSCPVPGCSKGEIEPEGKKNVFA